jgi:hypothetical protein
MTLKIEAVTVCVNYSDFLTETIKFNKGLFDRWLIITDPSDTATREVCRRFNLPTLLSTDGTRLAKEEFNKGRLIERGLKHVSAEGWRLHIDADIALPYDFRHRLLAADLQEDSIYGIDRIMIKSWDEWQALQKSGYLTGAQYDYHYRLRFPQGAEVGSRWCHPQFGYIPIGFFQLWHSSQDEYHGVRVKAYPMSHGNACRTDVQHSFQWDRPKRQLIPELIGVHLESQPAALGANWKGRKTKMFGSPEQVEAHLKKEKDKKDKCYE